MGEPLYPVPSEYGLPLTPDDMNHSVSTADQASADIEADSPVSAIVLTSFLFDPKPRAKGLLTFVDSCRKISTRATHTDPRTTEGAEWRRKSEAGELTEEELRTGLCDAFEGVIHRFLSGFRPGYRFAVHIAPESLWSAYGPKVQVENYGPDIDESIIEDLRLLMSLSQQVSIEPFEVEDAS